MSTITYNHENTFKYKKGGVDHFIKEDIKDGEYVTFKFIKRVGDKSDDSKLYSINAKEVSKGKYSVRENKGGKETENEETMRLA